MHHSAVYSELIHIECYQERCIATTMLLQLLRFEVLKVNAMNKPFAFLKFSPVTKQVVVKLVL